LRSVRVFYTSYLAVFKAVHIWLTPGSDIAPH